MMSNFSCSQDEAQQIDEELFTQCAFSVDQLMELAGLGCATVIQHVRLLILFPYPINPVAAVSCQLVQYEWKQLMSAREIYGSIKFCYIGNLQICTWEKMLQNDLYGNLAYPLESLKVADGAVLICCGPGNNGGDGLVCARHLKLFGYKPTVYYPRTPQKPLYKNLVTQCEKMGIPFLSYIPSNVKILESSYSLIVDALFGFGFRPPLRGEFAEVAQQISTLKLPLVCIDVPSGLANFRPSTSIYYDELSCETCASDSLLVSSQTSLNQNFRHLCLDCWLLHPTCACSFATSLL
ncbi:unnamed protein product [Dibothriocephalus latus]|uniref:NAD(P)H-hydrate epimerase n=1 Tax=Dibothriocephalus latus TaxID=60516 RepID=A0A3P6V558_DIBLA|nr:unnamed protein product [Dibothriocephalus latus]